MVSRMLICQGIGRDTERHCHIERFLFATHGDGKDLITQFKQSRVDACHFTAKDQHALPASVISVVMFRE